MTAVRVCGLTEITDGGAKRVELAGHVVTLVRLDGDVYAIGDRCTHQDVSLAEGEVDPENCTIECHKHGSAFDLRTGEPLSLPATKPTPTFGVEIVEGDVYLDLGGA